MKTTLKSIKIKTNPNTQQLTNKAKIKPNQHRQNQQNTTNVRKQHQPSTHQQHKQKQTQKAK